MRTNDIWSAVVLFAGSLLLLLWVIPSQADDASAIGLPPSFLPNVSAVTMAAMAVILFVQTYRRADISPPGMVARDWLDLLGWGAASLVMMGLLKWVGFLAAATFIVAVALLTVRYRGIVLIAGVSVGSAVVIQQLLKHTMGIVLS